MTKKILLLFCYLSAICLVSALNLNDCLESALQNNYKIQSQHTNFLNSKDDKSSALADFLPNLSVYSHLTRDNNSINYFEKGVNLTGEYALFDYRYYLYKANKFDFLRENINSDDTKKSIIETVAYLYYDILEEKEKISLYKQLVEDYQLINKVNSSLNDKGLIDDMTNLSTKISLQRNQINLEKETNYLHKLLSELSLQCGIKTIDKNDIENFSVKIDSVSLEYDYNNTNINKIQQFYVKSSSNIKKAKFSQILPTLSAGFNLKYKNQYDYINKITLQDDDWDNEWFLYINLSYSLNNLGHKLYDYKKAKRNYKNIKIYSDYLKDESVSQIESLINDIISLRKQLILNSTELKLTKNKVALALKRYQNGTISFVDVKESQIDFTEAKLSELQTYSELFKKTLSFKIITNKNIGFENVSY